MAPLSTRERFPGRQGRVVFAYLLVAHRRPIADPRARRGDLGGRATGDVGEGRLRPREQARALLIECGVDGTTALTSAFGCYQLTLPAGTWIDVAAADEAATQPNVPRGRRPRGALINGVDCRALARRTFLPGEDGRWVDQQRDRLREILVRALECLAEANRLRGRPRRPYRRGRADRPRAVPRAWLPPAHAGAIRCRQRRGGPAHVRALPAPCSPTSSGRIPRRKPRRSISTSFDARQVARLRTSISPISMAHPQRHHCPRPARLPSATGASSRLSPPPPLLCSSPALRGRPRLHDWRRGPPTVLPNSVVRIDPNTLEPVQVVRVGREPDLVVAAEGFVWVTHLGRGYTGPNTVRDSGDRTLTRIDTSTGDTKIVGGGLAPCGLAADPSGDVWVANCFAAGSGVGANVVRVDARTLDFEATWPVPAGLGYVRGLAYGGGSLWVADVTGAVDYHGVTKLDPRTGAQRRIELDRHAGLLAWSEGYGDLWMNDFERGSVSRMHAATGVVKTFADVTAESHLARGPRRRGLGRRLVRRAGRTPPRRRIGRARPRPTAHERSARRGSRPSRRVPAASGRPCQATTPCGGSTRGPSV